MFHHRNRTSSFKERSLRAIELRRQADKWLKILLFIFAIFMVIMVFVSYILG